MKKILFTLLLTLPFLVTSCDGDETITCGATPAPKESLVELKATVASAGAGVLPTVVFKAKGKIKVDWGDTQIIDYDDTGVAATISHTYQPGTYTIKITAEEGEFTYFETDGHLSTYDEIKLTSAPDLKSLRITRDTKIKSLDLSTDYPKLTNLEIAECSSLTHLILTGCPKLERLYCPALKLQSLDLTNNPVLKNLDCTQNELTTLRLTNSTKLDTLYAYKNNLETLDVSKCTELLMLLCSDNQLKTLDVSANLKMEQLSVFNNQLSAIDLSKNTNLYRLSIATNQFTAESLNTVFGALPQATSVSESRPFKIFYLNNPGADTCDPGIFIDKGWTPM